jgi:hypothetical protein
LLALTRRGYLGSLSSGRSCFFMVLRARPVRLEISRMDIGSLNVQRLVTYSFNAATSITPDFPLLLEQAG